jgi:hypothetical protein
MNATLTTQANTATTPSKSDAVGGASLSFQRTAENAEPATQNLSQIAGARAFPDTRFGHDFGRVQVHDSSAIEDEEDEFSMIAGNDAGPGSAPDAGTTRSDAGTPPAVTVTTTSGPIFNGCGSLPGFRWCVAFTTSRRHGWLVQRVDSTWNASHCDGSAYGAPSPPPQYWEAWPVDGNGNVPLVDAFCPNANDRWDRSFCSRGIRADACRGRDSRGTWSIAGTLYHVNRLPADFIAGSVRAAGSLYATMSDPGAVLGPALSTRTIGGTWNCCAPSNTHRQS